MSFYIYFILGILGGIPSGMGMGGGTVTIPLLVILGGVEQKIAQGTNLFSFLLSSPFAIKVHNDNGLIKKDGIMYMIIPALITSILGSIITYFVSGTILRQGFGVFLVILSFFSIFKYIFLKST